MFAPQIFPDKEELVRNMMGLLGNVAEVPDLRHRLMEQQFIQVFADLLDSMTDGIEVRIADPRTASPSISNSHTALCTFAGELQCGRRDCAHCLRRAGRVDGRVAKARRRAG